MATTNGDKKHVLNHITPEQVAIEIKDPVDPKALEQAKAILQELRQKDGETSSIAPTGVVRSSKLLEIGKRFGDIAQDATTYVVSSEDCKKAFEELPDGHRQALVNIHGRVKAFAEAQRATVKDMEMDIPGGKAGHTVSACKAAGCYAPGGRYPLPSSVVMTVATARAAGCEKVILASPKPAQITLAAAHIAGVDQFLCVGGAQAIAAMAYGVDGEGGAAAVARCDCICGPGNKWVTAAKSIVNGYCGIDMLAGPSEVLVICDDTANPEVVAADLIAQAEHDVVARAILLSTDSDMIKNVDAEVAKQIDALPEPNKSTALEALKQSFAIKCDSIDQCVALSDDIAPEHLEIQTREAMKVGEQCANYGGLFVGEHAAEVLGDYGAGPNHTLPTGATSRYTGGLSVFNFLRIRTWMRVDKADDSQPMVQDSIVMARLEGLEGHARAAEKRQK
ncbi:Histidinol dehydrogenase [Seminavis robusta]|uniref:Histidinol dehydrogenase n=1 Tax=Seminavis robusta TaxID=568900 RepID=A0A9N8HIK8_9STRA|nr:Histidinol dehydrogenase [Seminavis robusta]|eukprot:Sro627_g177950.1 Histidinol dehydrogenase (450) ;mRNA; r:51154-52633